MISRAGRIQSGLPTYHLSLIGHHRSGGRNDLRPSRFTDTHPAVQQLSYHVNAVVFESVVFLAKPINHASDPAGHIDGLNVHLHQLAQLLSHRPRRLAQRERLGRIQVKENPDEKNGEDHVELMLAVNAPRMFSGFQRERKHVGGEMSVRNISNAIENQFSRAKISSRKGYAYSLVMSTWLIPAILQDLSRSNRSVMSS